MNRFTVRGRVFAAIALLGLSAGTLLTSCEKEHEGPDASVCSIAATVVDKAGTGLVLQLTDGSYVVPSGSNWTDFKATVGQAVTVGYKTEGKCGSSKSSSNGQTVKIGCITAVTPTTTTTTSTSGTTGTGSN